MKKTIKAENIKQRRGFDVNGFNNTVWYDFVGRGFDGNKVYGRVFMEYGEHRQETSITFEIGDSMPDAIIKYFKERIYISETLEIEGTPIDQAMKLHIEKYNR